MATTTAATSGTSTAVETDAGTATETETETTVEDPQAANVLQNATEAYADIEDFNATLVTSSTSSNGTVTETENTTQKISYRLPNQYRVETLAPESQAGNVVVSNGSSTTTYDAGNNTVQTFNTSDYSGGMNESSAFGSLTGLTADSNVSYEGTATIAGEDVYVLAVRPDTELQDINETIYLDQDSYFPVRVTTESSYEVDNETITTESMTTFRDVQINIGLSDDLFEFEAPEDAERPDSAFGASTYDSFEATQENTNITLCEPSEIPEGYSFENSTVTTFDGNTSATLLYTNGSDDLINDSLVVRVSTLGSTNESATTSYGENVTVNDQNGTYAENDGQGVLAFSTGDRQYTIAGPFSQDELVSIAESLDCSVDTSTNTSSEANPDSAYYQVDFVTGDSIENLRGDEGYYTSDRLIRFAHGNTDNGVTRVSDGEFIINETAADRIESEDISVENGTATITFSVTEGESIELTLASYQKTGDGWSAQTEAQQRFIDADTQTFESGTHTLSVDLPGTDIDSTDGSEPVVVNEAENDDGLSAAEILDRTNQSYQNVSDITADYATDSHWSYDGDQYYSNNASGTFTFKAPNQTRYDFTNGSIFVNSGNTSTLYNASNNSATVYPNYSPHGIVNGIDNQSYLGSYLDLINQSNTVVYEGTTTVEGGEAYVFSLTPQYDYGAYYTESTTLYLNTETYLPLGSDYAGTYGNASNGTDDTYTVNTRYSNLQVNTGVSDDEFNLTIPDGTSVTDYSFGSVSYEDYDSLEETQQDTGYTIPQPTELPDGYSFVNATVWTYPPTSYTAGDQVENLTDVDLYYSDGSETIEVYMYQLPENDVFYGFGTKTPINGQAGYFESLGGGYNYLNFACGDLDYSIYGQLSRSELVTIGESVNCTADVPTSSE
ncbi:DUF4367 domain-containing protein [Halococcus sp. IIIV-5B]|uniref:DUF4367 domain-containing protein n=1 Tax=Halococcus sp. IIIV-5B TaxID=2321230 RepID=UPI001314BCE8|nr:DUF4367 domain-containing protein [Halococcus sp. IIIV-5B]